MTGINWLSTNVGKEICKEFPSLSEDIVAAFVSADKDLDNYVGDNVFTENHLCLL